MTRDEAKKILETESLIHYNWFNQHELNEDEVGIDYVNGKWIVYATDERASIVSGSVVEFSSEEEALDNFIYRVRTEKILFE